MGSLLRFPLSPAFVDRFPYFIETGTGNGISLKYAAQHEFWRLWTIDCWEPHYVGACQKFGDDYRVMPLLGKSVEVLENLLLPAISRPTFFFLDAHLPGCDFDGRPPNYEPDPIVRFPLKWELEIIRQQKPEGDYCLLIDDLRFYQDGEWGDGDIVDEKMREAVLEALVPEDRNLGFLEPFYETHVVKIEKRDSGYAIITPYGAPTLEFRD